MKRTLVIGILIGAIASSCIVAPVVRLLVLRQGNGFADEFESKPLIRVTPDGWISRADVPAAWLLGTKLATDHDLYAAYEQAKSQPARDSLAYLLVLSGNEKYYDAIWNVKDRDWHEVQVWIACLENKAFVASPRGDWMLKRLCSDETPVAQIWAARRAIFNDGNRPWAATQLDRIVARHDQWSVRAAFTLCSIPDRKRDALLYLCDTAVKGGEDGKAAVGAMIMVVDDPALYEPLLQYVHAPSEATLNAVVAAVPEYRKRLATMPTTTPTSSTAPSTK